MNAFHQARLYIFTSHNRIQSLSLGLIETPLSSKRNLFRFKTEHRRSYKRYELLRYKIIRSPYFFKPQFNILGFEVPNWG